MRVHPAFLYAGHPLASVGGPFNAVTVESAAITEITMSGPGAGGPQTASAVLGDVVSAMIPPARAAGAPLEPLRWSRTSSRLLPAPGGGRRPGVLAAVAQVLGEHGVSVKSVVQRGMGEQARLVMVTHPVLESSLRARWRPGRQFDFVRPPPRAIRVIEEEFA